MAVDVVAVTFSLLGGIFMGSYPVPIKCERVLKVAPHPTIFQCYKTAWVFISGWLFLLFNDGAGFQFSWWAVVSAFCWVPSGICTIYVTPMIGVGLSVVLSTCSNASLSFLVFWLVFGTPLKLHGSPPHQFFLAPLYLTCLLVGMVGLVVVARVRCRCEQRAQDIRPEVTTEEQGPTESDSSQQKVVESAPMVPGTSVHPTSARGEDMGRMFFILGIGGAVLGGAFSASQFGVACQAKIVEQRAADCLDDLGDCPAVLREQFNNFGSWMTSFGLGSVLATSFFLILFALLEKLQKRPLPPLHLRTLLVPGTTAGICWALGNFFQLAAVMRGGAGVMAATNQCFQLVTSGIWGLLYYREITRPWRIAVWTLAAVWTVSAAVLLSGEKAG